MNECALVIHAINLKVEEQRRASFEALNRIGGVKFFFEEGVDGQSLDPQDLVRRNLIRSGTKYFTQSHLGCGLAHRRVWLKVLQQNQSLIICEDDAVFRGDLKERYEECVRLLPTDWHLLLMAYNFDSVLELEIIPGIERFNGQFGNRPLGLTELERFRAARTPVTVLPLRHAFGTPAYAITPVGARYLLSNVFPLHNRLIGIPGLPGTITSCSIDCIMNSLYKDMNAYAVFPPLAVVANRKKEHDPQVSVP